jgi:hypothetical protein
MADKEKQENQVLADYVKKLRWKLFWMSGKKKKLLIDETKAHLQDLASDIGGKKDDAYRKAIDRFGTPKQIARNYKYLYGYGKKFIIAMIVLTIIFSALTIPFFSNFPPVGDDEEAKDNLRTITMCCGVTSIIFTILTFAVIIFTGIKGGRWHGLAAGIAAFCTRTFLILGFVTFYAWIGSMISDELGNVEINVNFGAFQISGMFFISILMVVAGVVAGRGIKALRKEKLFEEEDEDDEDLETF